MQWFYFYTPDYEFWHEHLSSTLANHFALRPIPIENDQLRLHEGAGHHFTGVGLKLQLIYDCVRRCRGETIVFSDCTQFVHPERVLPLRDYLGSSRLQPYDIVLASDAETETANIGLLRIRCSSRTTRFWKRCVQSMKPTAWDQRVVNKRLARSGRWKLPCALRWTLFDEARVVCGHELKPEYRDSFYLYKQFIHPADATTNWNARMTGLYRAGLVDEAALRRHLR